MSRSTENLLRQEIRRKEAKLRGIEYHRDRLLEEIKGLQEDLEKLENK